MSENPVAADVAEDEFNRFCEAMDLDVDESVMSSDDKDSFRATKRKVTRSIERGHLVINENGEPVFTPQGGGDPIIFHEPTGATLLALDNGKKGQDVHKAYHALADLTREPVGRFSKMQGRDIKVCQALMTLFLA